MVGFYSEEELIQMGFGSVGTNVLLSTKAAVYGVKNIHLGDNVRIDDFCVIFFHAANLG